MDRDKLFISFSAVLLLLISLIGPGIEFNGLIWNLVSTPGGMIYTALSGGEKLTYWINYLLGQQTSSSGNILQALLSLVASATGLSYIVYRTDYLEVEFR